MLKIFRGFYGTIFFDGSTTTTIIPFCFVLNRQSARSVEVLVGTNDLTKGGKYYKVAKLQAHEHYNNPSFAYDIAVILLKDKIEFNDKVKAIELARDDVPDGAQVQLTGWGRLRAGGSSPTWLQIIKLDFISTQKCKEIYGGRNVHDTHVCTLTRVGEGACNGDSGRVF